VSPHKPRTRLGELRRRRIPVIKQEAMAERTGIPLRTYQRLEAGKITNPPIRYLVNCAIVLGVDLEEVCEPEWLRWSELSAGADEPTG
jgi:transcriptional regulator with XRE-family HTH domain